MSDNIVPLIPAQHPVAMLRKLADDIEAGLVKAEVVYVMIPTDDQHYPMMWGFGPGADLKGDLCITLDLAKHWVLHRT